MYKHRRIWWALIALWLVVVTVLSAIAPGAKEFAEGNSNGGLPDDVEAIIADEKLHEHFPQDEGMPLFSVLYKEEKLTESDIRSFTDSLAKIEKDTEYGRLSLPPVEKIDVAHLNAFLSEDETTFFIPITLPADLEGSELHDLISQVKEETASHMTEDIELSWTGPAAIAADAVELFSRADIVLLLSTVGIILILLLVIYRSPLLTLMPLIGAAIVYGVVDRLIGLMASLEWFTVESQALSIMSVLLFAVVTDYSLLIFSRYREELSHHESAHKAMAETIKHVREPIYFSGGTIVLGVATLFISLYEPYRNFAPVFVIAAATMLIAGLTLLPALFAVLGRKAFWPVIPQYGERLKEKSTFWGSVAKKVTKKPLLFMIPIVLLLLFGSWNATNMKQTFDLIESFPEDLSSRVGYERLSDSFSQGSLAPSTLLIESKQELDEKSIKSLTDLMSEKEGIESVEATGNMFSDTKKAAKLTLTFEGNPYDVSVFDTILDLRAEEDSLLNEADLAQSSLYIVGESAKNTDLRDINKRDTTYVMIFMTVLIAIMLGFQTRSVIAPLYMVGTLVLSFVATLGISIFLFKHFLNLDTISYRIPLYSFVFLIALGVDYTIMLIARIREEMNVRDFEEAVRYGVEKTGRVISSAGVILAATFLVLGTMPIYELKLFGFIMALGILIDTFIVRPLLIPTILIMLGKKSFWPKKI